MLDLAKEITEFFLGEKRPMQVGELIHFYNVASAKNSAWTKASNADLEKAIRKASDRGLLGVVGTTVMPIVRPATAETQLDLF